MPKQQASKWKEGLIQIDSHFSMTYYQSHMRDSAPKDGEDIMFNISVTEAIALNAAFRTSCEHPGFTMLFTCKKRKGEKKKKRTSES